MEARSKKNFLTRGQVSIFSNTFFSPTLKLDVLCEDCKEVATSLSNVWPIFEAIIDLARNNDWRQYVCASVCTNC